MSSKDGIDLERKISKQSTAVQNEDDMMCSHETDNFIKENEHESDEKVSSYFSALIKKENSQLNSQLSSGVSLRKEGRRRTTLLSKNSNVGKKLDIMYRIESHNKNDRKGYNRQKLKILFFFTVDLLVFCIALAGTVKMYHIWEYKCKKNFNAWGISIIVLSFLSMILNIG